MRASFACGHRAPFPDSIQAAPTCPICGETRVQHVQTRAPRFVGVATGPYAEFRPLEAVAVNVAPKGPLSLKEQE